MAGAVKTLKAFATEEHGKIKAALMM